MNWVWAIMAIMVAGGPWLGFSGSTLFLQLYNGGLTPALRQGKPLHSVDYRSQHPTMVGKSPTSAQGDRLL